MNTQPPSGRLGAISLERIAAMLGPFRPGLSRAEMIVIREYMDVLLQWNQSVNLTAIQDPAEILVRHFGESLFGASILEVGESRLADVGSGAGFPGLAMKIACPGIELTLLESNAKKCAFLREVIDRLRLSQVKIIRQRYEELQIDRGFDIVCTRALGDYHIFLPWARDALKSGGRIALWLGVEESMRLVRRREFSWDVPLHIPESRRRVILIGTKRSE